MRPSPKSLHFLAVLVFIGVSAASVYLAALDERLSDRQVSIAAAAIKRHDPAAFAGDLVFGTRLWQFHTPAFQSLVEMTLIPTGYQDVTLPFRAMVGVLLMVYLCGMYVLLYRQCRSWSVACFVAVLSAAMVWTPGGQYWGLGSLASVTPAAIVVAVTPLIVVSFLHYMDQPRLMLVFAAVGVFGNFHLATAMCLTIVLGITYLGARRFRPSAWAKVFACGLCALVGALPHIAYSLGLRWSIAPGGAQVPFAATVEALRLGDSSLFYPEMLASLLNWSLMAAVLVIPAAVVLSRVERFRTRDIDVWVYFAAAALLVGLGFQGLMQTTAAVRGGTPLLIDFVRATPLTMLPLYVLFAQMLTNLFRMVRTHRVWLRWACVALAVAWIAPSDNFRVARHRLYAAAAGFMEEADRPLRIQEIRKRDEARAELDRIAVWAREPAHTDPAALFVVDSVRFRMLARRGILAGEGDVDTFCYSAPWRLEAWSALMRRQAQFLRPEAGGKTNPHDLKKFVDDLAGQAEYGEPKDREWYVVLRAASTPDELGPLEPVESAEWGTHYRLCRIR